MSTHKGGPVLMRRVRIAAVQQALTTVSPRPEELIMVVSPDKINSFLVGNNGESEILEIRPPKELLKNEEILSADEVLSVISNVIIEREIIFRDKQISEKSQRNIETYIRKNSVENIDIRLLEEEILGFINSAIRTESKSSKSEDELKTQYFLKQNAVMVASVNQLAISPIGYLHLEKLNFSPKGVTRGELIDSIPLAPGEEIHVTHKTWSNHSEDFEKLLRAS